MDEVDEVLDRAAADLAERDAHIQFLQRQFEAVGFDPYAEVDTAEQPPLPGLGEQLE